MEDMWSEDLKGTNRLENLGINREITWKCISKAQDSRMLTGFIWALVPTRASGRLP
jgi:hypothetical protein